MYNSIMKRKKILFILIVLVVNLFSKDLEKVNLQLDWLNQFQFAGYYIAKEKGFYKEKGFDVSINDFTKETNLVEEVLKNEHTYAVGTSSLIIDKMNNKDIVLLAAIFQNSPLTFISLKSSNIDSIFDFKNKKIMITSTTINSASIKSLIKSHNIKFEDITFVPHSFDINDLIEGKVDVMTSYLSNEPYILKNKNIEFNLFNPVDYGFNFYSGLLFTSGKEVRNNPTRVKDFYDASIKGWIYAFNNIEESAKIIYEKYNTQNKTLDALIYEAKILKDLAQKNDPKYLGYINPIKINEIKRLYLLLGITTYSEVDFNNFIFDENKVPLTTIENNYLKNNEFSLINELQNIPFSFIKHNKIQGIQSDLIKLLCEKIDIKISNKKLNNLYFDIIYSTKNYNYKDMIHSKPLLTIPISLVTRSDINENIKLSDLKDKKIAILKNLDIDEKLKNTYKNINFVFVNNKQEAFDLIKKEEIYGFIDNTFSLSYTISKNHPSNIKISENLPFHTYLRISTKKENFLLIDIINKAIPYLEEEKKENILKKYQLIIIEQIDDNSLIYKFIIPLLFIILIFSILVNKMNNEINRRNKSEEELKEFVNKDDLTSIYNKRKIDSIIKSEILNSETKDQTFSILFFDIDDFKLINDNFGHIVGDEVLKKLCNLISKNIRQTDIFGRWGGEEFIVILSNTTTNKAFILADDLRKLVYENDFCLNKPISISIGITQYCENDSAEDIIKRADKAMYYVKKRGKNSVKVL